MKTNKPMSFEDLPDEVQELILLSEKDYRIRKKFGLVCKKWNGFVTSPYALATYGLFKKDDELKKTALSIPYHRFRNEFFSGKASQQQIEITLDRIRQASENSALASISKNNDLHGFTAAKIAAINKSDLQLLTTDIPLFGPGNLNNRNLGADEIIEAARNSELKFHSSDITSPGLESGYFSAKDLKSMDPFDIMKAADKYTIEKTLIAACVAVVVSALLAEQHFYNDDISPPDDQYANAKPRTNLLCLFWYYGICFAIYLPLRFALNYWNQYLVPALISPHRATAQAEKNDSETLLASMPETDEEEYDVENPVADTSKKRR